jgi:hypothetical protein
VEKEQIGVNRNNKESNKDDKGIKIGGERGIKLISYIHLVGG